MNRRTMLLLMMLVALPGCGVQRHAAESALIQVETDYGRMRDQLTLVAPDQARSIDGAISAAKGTLEKGDADEALRLAKELQTRLRETSDRLPAMQAELESAWTSLSASLPRTLATLKRDLQRSNRPPAGKRREVFDLARGTMLELVNQWEEAQVAMKDGRLAEAVAKAEDVNDRAVGLVMDTHEGS